MSEAASSDAISSVHEAEASPENTGQNTDPLRVIVADDSVLLRDGVVRLLTDSGFDVVAAVGDANTLLDSVTELSPDVCVVDVRMPPTHTTKGCGPHSKFAGCTRVLPWSCCRSTSRSGTRANCSKATSPVSVICSRIG